MTGQGPWTRSTKVVHGPLVHVLSSRDIYSLHAGSLQARFKSMIIPVLRSGQSPVHFTPCLVTTLFNLLGYKF